MPSSRNALKALLDVTVQKITQAETRLMKATSDDEREKLVETLADLQISQKEIIDALTEDGHG
jgi:hypothetical protein